ncbi:hypothetical protein ARSEF4850_004709 [Beauveria asiatica]
MAQLPAYRETTPAGLDKKIASGEAGHLFDEPGSIHSGDDILGMQDMDPALNQKMHLVNNAIDEIGWTNYHLKLFFLNGFGYCVDSMILLFQSVISSPAYKEFGSHGYKNGLTIAVYSGMFIGAIFWGFSADVIGRKYAFNISLFICSVACIVAGAMPSWASLAFFIALLGFGGGGNLVMDTTVFLEYLPGNKQWLVTFMAAWWGFGQAICGFIAWGFLVPAKWNCLEDGPCRKADNWGWRYAMFTGGALVLTMSVLRIFIIRLKETLKYLLSSGEDALLVKNIQALAKKYNRPCSLTLQRLEACGSIRSSHSKSRFSIGETLVHFRGLFCTKKIAMSTSLIWLSWMLIGLAYPLFYVFLPTYLKNRSGEFQRSTFETWRNYALTNVCGIPGPIIAGLMCNTRIFGRKYTMVVGSLLTMTFFFAYTAVKTSDQDLAFSCIIACVLNIYYGTLYAYTPEVLPSAHRGTGNGVAVALNRIMGIISAVIGTVADTSTSAPLTGTKIPRVVSYSSQRGDDAPLNRTAIDSKVSRTDAKTTNESTLTETEELGPLARRLQEATEEALLTGGRAGRQAVEDAGFSEQLKEKLMSKIADAKFKNDFAAALAETGTTSTGEKSHGSSVSAHQQWTGEERTEDAVLRMLNDSKKPLQPDLRGNPIDTRLSRAPVLSPGQKVASARDRASAYSSIEMKDSAGLSDKEKEEMKKQFRERFRPEGRIGPVAISTIASMANERIEDAIARGQFKNIPRGNGVESDSTANNPFIDTTEYLMNRLIQRQDLVPPWIEKQQELEREANTFRARLRSDWKRHAARMISSKGGSMLEQMQRAELYAAAERVHNPRRRGSDQIAVSSAITDDPVMSKQLEQVEEQEEVANKALKSEIAAAGRPPAAESSGGQLPRPFRDPAWEKAEEKYMTLAVERLNSLTRSYNLMAPDLAKKPYFSLARELAVCYATVAPLLANEIRSRATRTTTSRLGGGGGGQVARRGDTMDSVVGGGDAKVRLEGNEKAFGLKEWWRDFWKQ